MIPQNGITIENAVELTITLQAKASVASNIICGKLAKICNPK